MPDQQLHRVDALGLVGVDLLLDARRAELGGDRAADAAGEHVAEHLRRDLARRDQARARCRRSPRRRSSAGRRSRSSTTLSPRNTHITNSSSVVRRVMIALRRMISDEVAQRSGQAPAARCSEKTVSSPISSRKPCGFALRPAPASGCGVALGTGTMRIPSSAPDPDRVGDQRQVAGVEEAVDQPDAEERDDDGLGHGAADALGAAAWPTGPSGRRRRR